MVNFSGFVRPVPLLNIWLLFLQLFSPSLLTRPPLLGLFYVLPLHSLTRCKSILGPPLSCDFQPTNIIEPSSAESALAVFFLFIPIVSHLTTPIHLCLQSPVLSVPSLLVALSQILLRLLGMVDEGTSGRCIYTEHSTILHLRPCLYRSHLLFFPPGSSHFEFSLTDLCTSRDSLLCGSVLKIKVSMKMEEK